MCIRDSNVFELARYLAINLSEEQLNRYNLCEIVMRRKTNIGRKPMVTGYEMKSFWNEEESSWESPQRVPTEVKVKKMLAVAVMFDIERIMSQHTFRFRGKVYIQEDGGSISNELTGKIAKTRIIFVLRELKRISLAVGLNVLLLAMLMMLQ